jgi:hypothetical protein
MDTLTTNATCSALIGCECSGIVRDALRAIGIDAWSCDLKPCEKGSQYHIQGDVIKAIDSREWTFIGLHPDCTAMALSGNRWYGSGMPRHQERVDAISWTCRLWENAKRASDMVYLENPTGVLWKFLRADVQYIQPWQFGHGETKKTGFATFGLPYLEPTEIVEGREQRIWKMGATPTRKADRSRTYPGVAAAIASQWGKFILQTMR